MQGSSEEKLIEWNRERHSKLADNYDEKHKEIFNPTEQHRIAEIIRQAVALVATGSKQLHALDFGAGTGNLTRHMLDFGLDVTAADVSLECLQLLQRKMSREVSIHELNGRDLSGIPDESFDFIATYSVLHHIPDYLAVLPELVRVTKPGGIILIDHEACPAHWEENPEYIKYLRRLGGEEYSGYLFRLEALHREPLYSKLARRLRKLRSPGSWKRYINHRLHPEHAFFCEDGDIHVFKSKHIEWDRIRETLGESCEILSEVDYLVCREQAEPPPNWIAFQDCLTDMRMMIARKVRNAA